MDSEWRHTKNSMFSVRSAYHGEWTHPFRAKESNLPIPGASTQNKIWKYLWSSSVSAKVKIFAWKSLHGVLPCYGVLANRHIPVSAQCPRCSVHCEDIKHVLFTCDHAREIWGRLDLAATIDGALLVDRAGSAILEELICTNKEGDKKEMILTAAWYIWWMRRQLVHGENVPPNAIATMSIRIITQSNLKALRKNSATRKSKWVKSKEGFVMINIDASFKP